MINPGKRKGKVIVFSGIDGAGKSTQIQLFGQVLSQKKIPFVVVWSRGGYTPGMKWLKGLWRKNSTQSSLNSSNPQRERAFSNPVFRKFWLILSVLDLIFLYSIRIRLLTMRGVYVICDRYLWDTVIDFRLNFSEEQVEFWLLWKILVRMAARPDAALLLIIPIEEALRRAVKKNDPYKEPEENLRKRLEQYLEVNSGIWTILDCTPSIEQVAMEIQKSLAQKGILAEEV